MKDVEEMTLKEAIDEFLKMIAKYLPENEDNERFEELYTKITDEDAFIDVYPHDFTATISISTEDEEYEGTTNLISGITFDKLQWFNLDFPEELPKYIHDGYLFATQLACATSSLEKIQKELTEEVLQTVFKGNSVVSFEYLFANPRKEVVKWALKHKEELGLSKVAREFIEEYQAIPELKELILNTLEKKGE